LVGENLGLIKDVEIPVLIGSIGRSYDVWLFISALTVPVRRCERVLNGTGQVSTFYRHLVRFARPLGRLIRGARSGWNSTSSPEEGGDPWQIAALNPFGLPDPE
jgi:hypothetical protein